MLKLSKVYKLDKSLNGLKQSPKQWYEKFGNLVISNDFRIDESDKFVYYKTDNNH